MKGKVRGEVGGEVKGEVMGEVRGEVSDGHSHTSQSGPSSSSVKLPWFWVPGGAALGTGVGGQG